MKTVVFALAAVSSFGVFADRVYLKSGTVVSGEVIEKNDKELKVKSDDFGELKIKLESIVRLEGADAQPMPIASVKPEVKPPETWHGSITVAFNAARGNTYDQSAAVVANLNRKWEKDRVNIDFGYYYGEDGKSAQGHEKNTDRWEVEGKHDHFWREKVYHYENLRWERDVIQDLNSRYRAGLGGGYQWLDKTVFDLTGTWTFNQELGVNWVKEDYENNDDEKSDGFAALRYGHHLGYLPKVAENLEFFHNLEVLPDVDEWEKFLAKANLGMTTKLIYDFTLTAKVEWDYNSMPADDRKKSDYRYIVGLGYKW